MGTSPSHELIELCSAETPKMEKIKNLIKEHKNEIDFNLVVPYKTSEATCLVAAATISKSVELVELLFSTGRVNPFLTLKIQEETRDVFEYLMTLVKRIEDEEVTANVLERRKSSKFGSTTPAASSTPSRSLSKNNPVLSAVESRQESQDQYSFILKSVDRTPSSKERTTTMTTNDFDFDFSSNNSTANNNNNNNNNKLQLQQLLNEQQQQNQQQPSSPSAATSASSSTEPSTKSKLLTIGSSILGEMSTLRENPNHEFISITDKHTLEIKGRRVYQNTNGLNYWHLAVFDKSVNIFELLIDHSGACPFSATTPGNRENIFHLLAKMRDRECALQMLRSFCSSGLLSTNEARSMFDQRNSADDTAFEIAVREASPELVTEFVVNRVFDAGVSNNLLDLVKEQPLEAGLKVNEEEEKQKWANGFYFDETSQKIILKGFTPLHIALMRKPENNKNGEMVKICQILFAGMKGVHEAKKGSIFVVSPAKKEENLLTLAIKTGDNELVQFLLANGVQVRFPAVFEILALIEAGGFSDEVKQILKGGDDEKMNKNVVILKNNNNEQRQETTTHIERTSSFSSAMKTRRQKIDMGDDESDLDVSE